MDPYNKFKKILLYFGCFLIFQTLLIRNTPGILSKIIQNLDDTFVLLAFVYLIVMRLLKNFSFKMTPINHPLFILILLGAFSGLISKKIELALSLNALFLIVKGFILFYIFASVPFYKKDIVFYLKTFLKIGIVVGVVGLIAAVFPAPFSSFIHFDTTERRFGIIAAQSFLGHPGYFAMFIATLGCFSLAALLITRERKYLYLSLFFIICIIFSFRRTSAFGIIVIPVATSLYLSTKLEAFSFKNNKSIFVILLCLIPFLPIIMLAFQDLFMDYVVTGGSPRELLTFTGIKIAMDYFPLGSGPGTFGGWISRVVYSPLFYEYKLFRVWGLSPENPMFINDTFWPHILAEVGFLGTFVYLIIVIRLIRICKNGIFLLEDPTLRIFALGTFMLTFESLVESMKGTMFENTFCVYFWFGSIGIVWSLIKSQVKVANYELPKHIVFKI
jgi:hypothetical protein